MGGYEGFFDRIDGPDRRLDLGPVEVFIDDNMPPRDPSGRWVARIEDKAFEEKSQSRAPVVLSDEEVV